MLKSLILDLYDFPLKILFLAFCRFTKKKLFVIYILLPETSTVGPSDKVVHKDIAMDLASCSDVCSQLHDSDE